MTVRMSLTPETHCAFDSHTNSLTNGLTREGQTIQWQSVQNCPNHHHPVPEATRLNRNCVVHPVRLLTQTWVRVQGRKSESMLIWKSAPSKFSRVPSWKSIEHLTLQTRLSIAHRKTHYKPPVEPEAVSMAAELQSIKDKRFYTEVCENDTNEKVISGKWVLKSRKARYVLRGFEEDVKDQDVFASTIMTASVRMLLSLATVLRSEGRTVFTAQT